MVRKKLKERNTYYSTLFFFLIFIFGLLADLIGKLFLGTNKETLVLTRPFDS